MIVGFRPGSANHLRISASGMAMVVSGKSGSTTRQLPISLRKSKTLLPFSMAVKDSLFSKRVVTNAFDPTFRTRES